MEGSGGVDANSENTSKNSESVKVIFETAQKEYIDENDRVKQWDGKTTPLVAATGAVIIFVAGVIAAPPASLPEFWRGLYFGGVCLALSALAGAQVCFLATLWGRQFHRMALKEVVTEEWMESDPDELRHALADMYRKVVADNTAVTEQKATSHKRGLVLLNIGLGLLMILLLVSGAAAALAP